MKRERGLGKRRKRKGERGSGKRKGDGKQERDEEDKEKEEKEWRVDKIEKKSKGSVVIIILQSYSFVPQLCISRYQTDKNLILYLDQDSFSLQKHKRVITIWCKSS